MLIDDLTMLLVVALAPSGPAWPAAFAIALSISVVVGSLRLACSLEEEPGGRLDVEDDASPLLATSPAPVVATASDEDGHREHHPPLAA